MRSRWLRVDGRLVDLVAGRDPADRNFSGLSSIDIYWGFPLNGGTPKWMVYKGKSENKMDENWGYFQETFNWNY